MAGILMSTLEALKQQAIPHRQGSESDWTWIICGARFETTTAAEPKQRPVINYLGIHSSTDSNQTHQPSNQP